MKRRMSKMNSTLINCLPTKAEAMFLTAFVFFVGVALAFRDISSPTIRLLGGLEGALPAAGIALWVLNVGSTLKRFWIFSAFFSIFLWISFYFLASMNHGFLNAAVVEFSWREMSIFFAYFFPMCLIITVVRIVYSTRT